MGTTTKTKKLSSISEVLSNPYKLVLHNDDFSTFEWVISCLVKICGHEYEQATQCAYLVHYTGKCDVKYGDQETISKMKEGMSNSGLSVTMETI